MVADNVTWLLVVLSVMSGGRVDKNGKIELRRMIQALRTLRCPATLQEVDAVCRVLTCYDEANPALLYYNDFLQPLKDYYLPPDAKQPRPQAEPRDRPHDDTKESQFERQGENDNPSSPERPPPSPSQPGPGPESESRDKEENKDSPQIEEDKGADVPEHEHLEESVPDLDDSWCNGEFQVVINRCHDCKSHETYTRHSEDVSERHQSIEIHRHIQPDRKRAEEGLPDDDARGQLRKGLLHGGL
jgi:hypothetical protein